MLNDNYMLIDKIPVPIEGEKNILELVRKAGIDMPTFCYYSELSVYGACRMCMVEDERGNMHAACSTPPKAGMSVVTNSARLRKYRKNILELLRANHCRDCTTCEKSESCRLKELARRFYIEVKRGECTDCSHIITLPERPGELPEALLVAGLWRWPLEGRHIAEAYTAFPSWAKDATRTNYWVWYSLPQKGLCVSF